MFGHGVMGRTHNFSFRVANCGANQYIMFLPTIYFHLYGNYCFIRCNFGGSNVNPVSCYMGRILNLQINIAEQSATCIPTRTFFRTGRCIYCYYIFLLKMQIRSKVCFNAYISVVC